MINEIVTKINDAHARLENVLMLDIQTLFDAIHKEANHVYRSNTCEENKIAQQTRNFIEKLRNS